MAGIEPSAAIARDLAFADYLYAIGESGVMAMNPDLAESAFEKSWGANDATGEAMRERYGFMARSAARAVAEACRAVLEEAAAIIERDSQALNRSTYGQLRAAILALIDTPPAEEG